MRRFGLFILLTLLTAYSGRSAQVSLINVTGAIGPATASYIARALEISAARNDECLIIQLDTPGGLLDSTEKIVQSIYDAKVPTVVYVAPAPARAGSAGVFITMSADIAAMAPHTRIGAAHPVELGASGQAEKTDDTMKTKIENDTAAFAKSIAEKRHRNTEWAIASVRASESITAEEALEKDVVDLIADNLPDLLKQIDGHICGEKKLHMADATIAEIKMGAWEKFAQIFLRPEVMFILMLMVIYGFIGELSTPGAILPGVVGAIALVLVLYMSAILPVNIAGLLLIGLAVLLFIADIFASTHGVLTTGGIISFFLGALMLFNHAGPEFKLSLAWIIPATALTALFFLFIVSKGIGAQFGPAKSGTGSMLGKIVKAESRIDSAGGKVFIEGELWNATSQAPIESGQPVEIISVDGLTLKVKPKL